MFAKELISILKQYEDYEVEIITVKAKDLSVKSVYKSYDGKVKITNYEVGNNKPIAN